MYTGYKISMISHHVVATESDKPGFELELRPTTDASSGTDVKLSCKTSGKISSAEWSKDGQKVSCTSLFKSVSFYLL